MAISNSGIRSKISGGNVLITVSDTNPLVLLSNKLPWEKMFDIVFYDLANSTPKKQWMRGRQLMTRIHLGAYVLQQMNDMTDREVEIAIKNNASYQLFCGKEIVDKWHCPDHTKIEAFRSRLLPETHHKLANLICENAVIHNLANPHDVDIDSTIQEANMTYPTDAKMLRKLGNMAASALKGIKKVLPSSDDLSNIALDIKGIASAAREYFFLPKTAEFKEKSSVLLKLWSLVNKPVKQLVDFCQTLNAESMKNIPWNVERTIHQLMDHAKEYLTHSKIFIETGKSCAQKRLSFHLDNVACFNKKKADKKYEFGRAFQLGRISGNFIFVAKCNDVRMDDKKSFIPMLNTHAAIFGKGKLKSVTTDKGYYSKKNVEALVNRGVNEVGIQLPSNAKNKNITMPDARAQELKNRRAGIEPLIGHIKQGGQLGRSRMKNDQTIEASGYTSVLGFNLRQTINALVGRERKLRPAF